MKGDRTRCLEAGMDDYLSKPINRQALGAAMQRFGFGPAPSKVGDGESPKSSDGSR